LFPKDASYYFCKPNVARGLDVLILKEMFESKLRFGNSYSSVPKAYEAAKNNADKKDLIYIGGSTFVVSEII